MEQSPNQHLAGAKIRVWRKAGGLSAEALGARLDPAHPVPKTTIHNWEKRGKIARAAHQRRLAELGACEAADWLLPAPHGIPEAQAA
jgi:NAD+ synthase (glutamine-hydrolysing)